MQSTYRAPLPYSTHGAGPGLVLVHGVGATAQSTYGSVLGNLAQDFTVVAPDFSAAPPTAVRWLDVLADQHVEVANLAGVERFAMVGHSLGAMIAVRAAIRYPDKVAGLVLTAGFGRPSMSVRLKLQNWRALLLGDGEALGRYLMTVMLSDRYLDAMTEEQIEGFIELITLSVPATAAEQIDLALSLDQRSELSMVNVPTLVVSTAADRFVPPELSMEIAAAIPRANLAELDCGHHPGLESASQWVQLIRDFVVVGLMREQVAR